MHFRRLNGLEQGRIFVAILFPLIVLTSFGSPFALQASAAAQSETSPSASTSGCAAQVIPQARSLQFKIDATTARALAENSAQFATNAAGHNYSFVGISDLSTFNPATCGNVAIAEVSVDYSLNDVVLATHNGIAIHEGLQIFENPSLSRVIEAVVDNEVAANSGWWSGYQVWDVVNGITQPLVSSETDWIQPSVTQVTQCNATDPFKCNLLIWSALDDAQGGGNIAQTGTAADIDCSTPPNYTCGTPTYSGWWMFLNHTPFNRCSTSSYPVAVGDSIQAKALNGVSWFGGSSNQWQTSLIDNPGGWTCLSPVQVYTATTTYADTIFERAQYGATHEHLPQFNSGGSVTMTTNQYCFGTSFPATCGVGFYQSTSNNWYVPWYMVNAGSGCAAPNPAMSNICLVSVDTQSRFSETWANSNGA